MTEAEKIEGYLITMGLTYEKRNDTTWIVNDADKGLPGILLVLETPVVVIRVVVMAVPAQNREKFYEKVLKLNGEDLIYNSYAIVGDNLLLSNSMLVQTLDLEELQNCFDEMGVALAQHYKILGQFK